MGDFLVSVQKDFESGLFEMMVRCQSIGYISLRHEKETYGIAQRPALVQPMLQKTESSFVLDCVYVDNLD